MKTGTIASTLVALSLGASLTACGGAEISDGSQLPGDETASGEIMSEFEPEYVTIGEEVTSCDDNQYDHWRNLAALAVASANELGRWNAAKDFVRVTINNNPGLALSSEGLARCTNGCENIKQILELQGDVTKIIPRHDPALLRQYMVTFFDRQVSWAKSNPVPNHTLKLASVSDDICGFRYHFDVTGTATTTTTTTTSTNTNTWGGNTALVPTHSWKCVNSQNNSTSDNTTVIQDNCAQVPTQIWTMENKGGSNYQFKNGAGKCLGVQNNATNDGATVVLQSCNGASGQLFTANHKGSNNFELRNTGSGKCLDVSTGGTSAGLRMQIYSCWSSPNQTFNLPSVSIGGGSSGTTTTTTTAGSAINPSVLFNQLKFAGETENKFLMFQSTATQASIDPMGTMISGGSTAKSGSCVEGSATVTGSVGDCCVVSGKYGVLALAPWNPKTLYCKY